MRTKIATIKRYASSLASPAPPSPSQLSRNQQQNRLSHFCLLFVFFSMEGGGEVSVPSSFFYELLLHLSSHLLLSFPCDLFCLPYRISIAFAPPPPPAPATPGPTPGLYPDIPGMASVAGGGLSGAAPSHTGKTPPGLTPATASGLTAAAPSAAACHSGRISLRAAGPPGSSPGGARWSRPGVGTRPGPVKSNGFITTDKQLDE